MTRLGPSLAVLAALGMCAAACSSDGDANEAPSGDSVLDEFSDDRELDDLTSMTSAQCLAYTRTFVGVMGRGTSGDYDEHLQKFRAYGRAAPAERRDDFELVADAYEEAYQLSMAAGIDFSDTSTLQTDEAREAMSAGNDVVGVPEVEAAMERLERLYEEICPEV